MFLRISQLILVSVHGLRVSNTSNSDACPPGSDCPTIALEEHVDTWIPEDSHDNYSLALAPVVKQSPDTPDMFVAVFSASGNVERRQAVRQSWKVPNNIKLNFILCTGWSAGLAWEKNHYDDMLTLPCQEGYGKGLLTQKLVHTMKHFIEKYPNTKYFFKTDDDTYPHLGNLLFYVRQQAGLVYAGVMMRPQQPIRNPSHRWYEPRYVWPHVYPEAAGGGAGYVLDALLVKHFIERGVARNYMLWNEDRAVSVWVHKFPFPVTRVSLPGTDGYGLNPCFYMKYVVREWSNYKFILHHGLNPKQLRCMGKKRGFDCFC